MVGTTTADMRASFGAGISLPLAKRREQLQALQRLFTENEDSITEALKQDLSRPLVEAQYYDVLLPLSEIAKRKVTHMHLSTSRDSKYTMGRSAEQEGVVGYVRRCEYCESSLRWIGFLLTYYVNLVVVPIDKLLRHLGEWTAPERVRQFSVLTFPSSQCIVKEPYGVALIIGTWNYPFLLSLSPVAGAIAAGCTVVLKPSNLAPASAKLQVGIITPSTSRLPPLSCR
eukprot:1195649-Prorocentrum_minimum.AAC.5